MRKNGASVKDLWERMSRKPQSEGRHSDSSEYKEILDSINQLGALFDKKVSSDAKSLIAIQEANKKLADACKTYLDKKGKAFTSRGKSRRDWVSSVYELASSVDYRDCNIGTLIKEGKTWMDATWDMRSKTVDVSEHVTKSGMTSTRYRTDEGFVTLSDMQTPREKMMMAGTTSGELASRNVASSRLADILGEPSLVARSVSVRVKDGKSEKTGVLMEEAKGFDFNDGKKVDGMSDFTQASLSPEACRQISCLHIMDFVAGQVDRNLGNMFYQMEKDPKTGKSVITGVQGIDNDLAFGTLSIEDIRRSADWEDTKATSQVLGFLDQVGFVDEDFLENLKKMKELGDKNPEVLSFVFGDVITPDGAEMQALQGRLGDVVKHLEKPEVVKVKGLEGPDGWEMKCLPFLQSDKYVKNISDSQFSRKGVDAGIFQQQLNLMQKLSQQQLSQQLQAADSGFAEIRMGDASGMFMEDFDDAKAMSQRTSYKEMLAAESKPKQHLRRPSSPTMQKTLERNGLHKG